MKNNSLTLSDKLVLTALEILIVKQGEIPILRIHLANMSGVSPRTVTNSLTRLRERGIISVERPHTGTHYTYTLYEEKVSQIEDISLLTLLRSEE